METPPLIPFSTIINISISDKSSKFTPVTFNAASQANPELYNNERNLIRNFLNKYF